MCVYTYKHIYIYIYIHVFLYSAQHKYGKLVVDVLNSFKFIVIQMLDQMDPNENISLHLDYIHLAIVLTRDRRGCPSTTMLV